MDLQGTFSQLEAGHFSEAVRLDVGGAKFAARLSNSDNHGLIGPLPHR